MVYGHTTTVRTIAPLARVHLTRCVWDPIILNGRCWRADACIMSRTVSVRYAISISRRYMSTVQYSTLSRIFS